MKNNQNGFSAVEAALLLIIVGLIGFVGWFVWQSNDNVNKSLENTTSSSQTSTVPAKASGTLVQSADKKVQFVLAPGWVVEGRDDSAQGCGYQTEEPGVGKCVSAVTIKPKGYEGKSYWYAYVFSGQSATGKDWPGGLTHCKLINESTKSINGYDSFFAKTGDAKTGDGFCTPAEFYVISHGKYLVNFSAFNSTDQSQKYGFTKTVNSVKFLN